MKKSAILLIAVLAFPLLAAEKEEGFVSLFDGKTLNGWKTTESPESFKVEDGAIVANAKPRSHLIYVGDEKPFKNFELRIDVNAAPNSNGGVHFHTKMQDGGWLKYGFEAQVNNTYTKDPIKTGSIYQIITVKEAIPKDNEWFTMSIKVEGKRVIVKVNDRVTADYTEPEGHQPGKDFTRHLDEGTFGLQAHDDHSVVKYKNIRVKRLP